MKPRTYLLVVGLLTGPAIAGGLLMLESVLALVREGEPADVPNWFYLILAWAIFGPALVSWILEHAIPGLELKVDAPDEARRWKSRLLLGAALFAVISVLGLAIFMTRYHELHGDLTGLYHWPRSRRGWLPLGVVPEYLYALLGSTVGWLAAHRRMDALAESPARSGAPR